MEKIYLNKTKRGKGIYTKIGENFLVTSIEDLKKFLDGKQKFTSLSIIKDQK